MPTPKNNNNRRYNRKKNFSGNRNPNGRPSGRPHHHHSDRNAPDVDYDWLSHGALLIDKPAGITSFAVVEKISKAIQEKYGLKRREMPKVGHAGTLDPFATGLLVVLVGKGVKLSQFFLKSAKGYAGEFKFGFHTTTGDPTGSITEEENVPDFKISELNDMAKSMASVPYWQTPPMHSAKKKNGVPLYKLAHKGQEVERHPVLQSIYSFEIQDYKPKDYLASFEVEVSSGTYIRTLAEDYSERLKTIGHLYSLRRTSAGRFQIENAGDLDQIVEHIAETGVWAELDCFVPFDQLMDGYACLEATVDEARQLQQGQQRALLSMIKRIPDAIDSQNQSEDLARHSAEWLPIRFGGHLLGILGRQDQQSENWKIQRIFPSEPAAN